MSDPTAAAPVATAAEAAVASAPPSRHSRVALFALVAAISLVPIALVRYPPILDLPQQMAQMPLLRAALGDQADVYRVQWLAPNKLSYVLLGLGWLAGGAQLGPRIALALVLLALLGAIHFLAARFERPLANTVLASVFVWNASFYGGFFSFLAGAWPFALWLDELAGRSAGRPAHAVFVRAAFAAFLFYECHVLWLGAAAGLLVLFWLTDRERRRVVLPMAAALAPFLLAAASWTYATRDWAVEHRVVYEIPTLQRITNPRLWAYDFLGAVRGPLEPAALVAIALFSVLSIWSWRRKRNGGSAPALLWSAAAFGLATLTLPDKVDEAVLFSQRCGAFAGIFFVLGSPAMKLRSWLIGTWLVYLGYVAGTAQVWRGFDQQQRAGFEACRSAVPAKVRLVSLDFARASENLILPATFQMAAYTQLDHRVELNFSFAEHRSALVIFRVLPRQITWTRRLEHLPERLLPRDLDSFDYLLAHLPAERQTDFVAQVRRLRPVAGAGDWWLYKIEPGN